MTASNYLRLWSCSSIDIFLNEGVHPFCHPCLPVARRGCLSIHRHDGRHGVRPRKRVSPFKRRDPLGLLLGHFFIRGIGPYRPVEIEEELLIVALASVVVLLVGRRPAEYSVWQDIVEHPAEAGPIEPPQITFRSFQILCMHRRGREWGHGKADVVWEVA